LYAAESRKEASRFLEGVVGSSYTKTFFVREMSELQMCQMGSVLCCTNWLLLLLLQMQGWGCRLHQLLNPPCVACCCLVHHASLATTEVRAGHFQSSNTSIIWALYHSADHLSAQDHVQSVGPYNRSCL
jgi:hypothetical protein